MTLLRQMMLAAGTLAATVTSAAAESVPPPDPPAAFAYQTETQAALDAYTTAGSSLGTAHARALDRFIVRGKADGWWADLSAPKDFIHLLMPTEAQFLINIRNPGSNLTKGGSPTYSASSHYNANGANTNYYESPLTLTDISQNAHTVMVCVTGTQISSNGLDMGAISTGDSSRGVSLTSYTGSNAISVRSFAATGVAGSTDGRYAGTGWTGFARTSSTQFQAGKHGFTQQTLTQTSGTIATANMRVRLLQATNNATQSARDHAGAMFCSTVSMPNTRRHAFARAAQDWVDSVKFGCPYIEYEGVGTAEISADVVVYGLSVAAIIAAYEAKRTNPSMVVALVGAFGDETNAALGGHPASGLGYIDTRDYTKVSGIFYDMIAVGKVYDGSTIAVNQAGMNMTARSWNLVCRRMLDPTKSTGTLPGLDIKVYMTGGIHSFSGNTLVTKDGRTFTADSFIDGDYIGDFVYKSGAPYIIGQNAAGTGYDADDGYKLPNRLMSHAGNDFRPDPYITPATPASGLLPDMVADPGLAVGAADPCIQSMNKRLAMTQTPHRGIPWSYIFNGGATPPRNYSATRYELFARYCALVNAAAQTVSLSDVLNADLIATGVYDVNNGTCGFSTDLPNIGLNMIAAGQDLDARWDVIDDYNDYILGLFYFIIYSGDSRIQAAFKTAFEAYMLDAWHFLDEGSHNFQGLPHRIYMREPIYRLQSDLIHSGADYYRADNGIPATFSDPVSRVEYDFDKHAMRRVAYNDGSGVTAFGQGAFGGQDTGAGVSMRAMTPPEAVATNVLHAATLSGTSLWWSAARMEFTLGLCGQAAGMMAVRRAANNNDFQDEVYADLRTALLADPDTVPMAI